MPYEAKPGEIALFETEKMGNERAPDYRGYVIAHRDIKVGEKLSIALWRGRSDSARSFGGAIGDFSKAETKLSDVDLFGNVISKGRMRD